MLAMYHKKRQMNANLAAVLYLVAGVVFILSLRGLSSPATSRQGNFLGMIGMAIAIATTIASHPPADGLAWVLVIQGVAIGGGIGAVIARRVPMTSMPELVAAFHSLVGMAAEFVYRHEWTVGDLLIWDNTGVMYRVERYPADSGRIAQSDDVVGEKPIA
jgi:NAD/NADP transhydrogenase beta subunit